MVVMAGRPCDGTGAEATDRAKGSASSDGGEHDDGESGWKTCGTASSLPGKPNTRSGITRGTRRRDGSLSNLDRNDVGPSSFALSTTEHTTKAGIVALPQHLTATPFFSIHNFLLLFTVMIRNPFAKTPDSCCLPIPC